MSKKEKNSSSDSPENKLKALNSTIEMLEKEYGKGSIMKLGGQDIQPIDVVSTGSLTLDAALGVGGLPRGRVIEVYGPEASGKTTLTLHVVAEVQKQGGIAAFIDAEHALDPIYAKAIGVDVDNLLISQPDTGEQALEIADALVRSSAVDVVVIDSVAALVPKAEIEGEMGDSFVGLHARLMSQALRKLTGAISKTNTIVIFINQLREKVGVMYGNPETTTGGRALKFYSSVRLDIRRVETLKNGKESIGSHTRVKVVKNKVAPPFREAEFDIYYGEGVSHIAEIADLSAKMEFVKKGGAWFTLPDGTRIQGRDSYISYLKENPDFANEMEEKIRERLSNRKSSLAFDSFDFSEDAPEAI